MGLHVDFCPGPKVVKKELHEARPREGSDDKVDDAEIIEASEDALIHFICEKWYV